MLKFQTQSIGKRKSNCILRLLGKSMYYCNFDLKFFSKYVKFIFINMNSEFRSFCHLNFKL
jgi:hypothetical protein